jgi:predicted nucleic acid-binding protein
MKKVLIDTDVLLDFFLDRESFSRNAARILSLCEKKEISGFASIDFVVGSYKSQNSIVLLKKINSC